MDVKILVVDDKPAICEKERSIDDKFTIPNMGN